MSSDRLKTLYFRNDDVYSDSPRLRRFLDAFLCKKIPVHLTVIPGLLSGSCRDYLKDSIKRYPGIIEIGQHGYGHENHGPKDREPYEFGPSRSRESQELDIKKGLALLRNSFRKDIPVFTPPWHGFNAATLDVISTLGFRSISLDSRQGIFLSREKIDTIPVHLSFHEKDGKGVWKTYPALKFFNKAVALKVDPLGILFHHDHFSVRDIARLNLFLDLCKKNNMRFILLSAAPHEKNRMRSLGIKKSIYFLTYQFIPSSRDTSRDLFLDGYGFFSKCPAERSVDPHRLNRDLYEAFQKNISLKLSDSRGPVGLLLSGGVDSAALLHTVRQVTARKIYTLTAAFDSLDPRLLKAKFLSRQYGTSHEQIILKPKDLMTLKDIYKLPLPAPIGDNGLVPMHLMLRRMKKKTDTIFSGDGADCLFGGLKVPAGPSGWPGKTCHSLSYGEIFLSPGELKILFENRFRRMPDLLTPLKDCYSRIQENDPAKRRILFDLNFLAYHRIDYLLVAAKINNICLVLPYLDRLFVGHVLALPGHFFRQQEGSKLLLREVFRGKLHETILLQRKEGFSIPFYLWYTMNKEFIVKTMIESKRSGVSSAYIKYLIRLLPLSRNYNIGMKIWLMLNLVLWEKS